MTSLHPVVDDDVDLRLFRGFRLNLEFNDEYHMVSVVALPSDEEGVVRFRFDTGETTDVPVHELLTRIELEPAVTTTLDRHDLLQITYSLMQWLIEMAQRATHIAASSSEQPHGL